MVAGNIKKKKHKKKKKNEKRRAFMIDEPFIFDGVIVFIHKDLLFS